MWAIIALVFLWVILSTFAFIKWRFNYWKRRNVYCALTKFPFGYCTNPFSGDNVGFGLKIKDYYDHYKSLGLKGGGAFQIFRPVFVVVDLQLFKNIFSKDFAHFTERGLYYNKNQDPLSCNLITLHGYQWKSLKSKINPAFTSSKIKMMFEAMVKCGMQLEEELGKFSKFGKPTDIKDTATSYTIDLIGSCAFGLNCNTFANPNSPFASHIRTFFKPTKKQLLKISLVLSFPDLARRLGVALTPTKITNFFLDVIKDTVNYREGKNVERNDFLQLLINIKNAKSERNLTIEEICAQSFMFFLAGHETSSATIVFCLYELALNQKIQERVREEIHEILEKNNGRVTYEAVTEMKYLDRVIEETLRKYPPTPYLLRKCTKDYRHDEVFIEKSSYVGISIFSVHHDPEYFPEPQKFDPERFNDDNRTKIRPFTYIPFGEGPRICIGLRFGLMQTKIGLIYALKNHTFTLNAKTEQPLELYCRYFILSSKKIFLDVHSAPKELLNLEM